jgi:hypothetical protein
VDEDAEAKEDAVVGPMRAALGDVARADRLPGFDVDAVQLGAEVGKSVRAGWRREQHHEYGQECPEEADGQ